MKPEYKLVGQGLLLIGLGVAALTTDDDMMHRSGGYSIAAGLLAIGFAVWAIRRGGWTTTPPSALLQLRSVPTSGAHACPRCASNDTRPMTAVETTAFYGYDRFVIARPRACGNCGHAFERDSKLQRVVLATLIVLGTFLTLVPLSFAVFTPWLAWRQDPFVAADFVYTAMGAGVALCGAGVILLRAARALRRLRGQQASSGCPAMAV